MYIKRKKYIERSELHNIVLKHLKKSDFFYLGKSFDLKIMVINSVNMICLNYILFYWKGDEMNGSSFSGKSISNVYCFTNLMFILFL